MKSSINLLCALLGATVMFTACEQTEENPDGLQKMTVTDNQIRFDKTILDVATQVHSNPDEENGTVFYFFDAIDRGEKYSLRSDLVNTSFGHDIDVCRQSDGDYALMFAFFDEAASLDYSFGVANHPRYDENGKVNGEYDYYGHSSIDEKSAGLKEAKLRVDNVDGEIVLTFNAVTTDGHIIQARVKAKPAQFE